MVNHEANSNRFFSKSILIFKILLKYILFIIEIDDLINFFNLIVVMTYIIDSSELLVIKYGPDKVSL